MNKAEELYSRKAKTVYRIEDLDRDSLTAFDGDKKAEVSKKGYYNSTFGLYVLRHPEVLFNFSFGF